MSSCDAHIFYGVVLGGGEDEQDDDLRERLHEPEVMLEEVLGFGPRATWPEYAETGEQYEVWHAHLEQRIAARGACPVDLVMTGYSYGGPLILAIKTSAQCAPEWEVQRLESMNIESWPELIAEWLTKLGLPHSEPGFHFYATGGES